jgi:hypothetical protein
LCFFFSSADIHSAFSLDSDTFDAIFSQPDNNVYHRAHVVHRITSTVQSQKSFHHSAAFFHDCLALSKASCFFVILYILLNYKICTNYIHN